MIDYGLILVPECISRRKFTLTIFKRLFDDSGAFQSHYIEQIAILLKRGISLTKLNRRSAKVKKAK